MQATVMVVSVTASTTAGQPLSEDALAKLLHACDAALQLDRDKADILKLVQMKMHHIAPNLSAAVGTEIAARLMGIAGGLSALSKMPACNVQVPCCSLPLHGRLCWLPELSCGRALHTELTTGQVVECACTACRCWAQRGSTFLDTQQRPRACIKASSSAARSYR